MMKARFLILTTALLLFYSYCLAQDQFSLKPGLEGQHPRILFTAEEASARALVVKTYLPQEWASFMNDCRSSSYPSNANIRGQQQWWYFSRLGIGIAMSGEQELINMGAVWLSSAYAEEWKMYTNTVDLDVAHKLAGFAILYDCMYPHLNDELRTKYEELLGTGLVNFRIHGYDQNDYWTNDYQNNHMHFRASASLYCAIILSDKEPSLQAEFDYVMTVWRRIAYMAPPDGSNHEGLNYANYGGQMLLPAIAALKHCTEMDLSVEDHFLNMGYYYLYHVTPGYNSAYGFGDSGNGATASGPNYLFQLASQTQDPHINYLAHKLREKHSGDFFLRQWSVLFNDPLLDRTSPERLPLHRYFEDLGVVITRSSWKADATGVAFKCGPMGGHRINETRGTEYSHYTDYVNVAHDDPDAGTFLLFSKGSFLTTGDGYEKIAKVTQNHSTFIVDDETQAGGGAGWGQPKSPDQYAWQKDVFAANNRVVFTGDMTGVYTDMQKLERTFVSHKAGYILIYDQARSNSAGRTFEWRLQTTGDLNGLGDQTYKVEKGNASVLTHILQPTTAQWSTTTSDASQIDGKILRARLEGQQENNFLVMLWPNGTNLDALTESYETPEYNGAKVSIDGRAEYSLFKNESEKRSTLNNFSFSASTLLLVEEEANQILESALLVNGDSLSYGEQFAMYADMPLNFGLESMDPDGSEMRIRIAPSSGTMVGQQSHIELGKLIPDTHYTVFFDQDTSPIEMISDSNGWGSITLDLEEELCLFISKLAVNPKPLEQCISDAQWLYEQSAEGNAPEEYLPAQRALFLESIDSASNVLESYTGQAEVDQAVLDLKLAMEEFEAGVNTDAEALQTLIDDAFTLLNNAEEGEEEGMYQAGLKASLLQMIQKAEGIAEDEQSTQDQVDKAVMELIEAIYAFKLAVNPEQILHVFSAIPYYGDIQNYFQNSESIWEVVKEDGNVIVGMQSFSSNIGQYMLVRDSAFKDFDLEFDARSVDGDYPSDIMIAMGYQDDNNYSFIKLSETLNKSGIFTKAGSANSFNWLLTDYETYGVSGHEWAGYRVLSIDSVITVYRDGQELFVVEPQAGIQYSGQVGMGTYYKNRAYFDNVRLTGLGSISGLANKALTGIRCYPNPVENILTLEPARQLRSISLFDCTGKVVISQSCQTSSRLRLKLGSLPEGIYFLRYIFENGSIGHERIVKN